MLDFQIELKPFYVRNNFSIITLISLLHIIIAFWLI